jgi:hypothetical protein
MTRHEFLRWPGKRAGSKLNRLTPTDAAHETGFEMATLWDPLENVSDLSKTLVADARRREIRNILKSYVGFFDPFAEAIQNAMDAVERRERVLGEPKFQKRLWISIDLKRNSFSVTDNGCGFTESEFKTFLCPSVSFNKDGETTRGRKGVGATYLAYGFNRLQLGTKTPDYEQLAEINEGRTWVEDENGLTPRPSVGLRRTSGSIRATRPGLHIHHQIRR